MDYGIYMDRTHDWLAGDGFYRARQLTGQSYEILNGDSFYPPTLLYLLVPFALGLPAVLWWLIPIAIIAAALIHIRPADCGRGRSWRSPCCSRRASARARPGQPSLWMIAAAFAGVAWAWPPRSCCSSRRSRRSRSSASASARGGSRLGALVLLSVPFGAMWRDY